MLYARNGPAVLVTRRAVLDAGSLYGDAIAGLVVSEEDSIDIDTPFDVRVAELLLSHHEKIADLHVAARSRALVTAATTRSTSTAKDATWRPQACGTTA